MIGRCKSYISSKTCTYVLCVWCCGRCSKNRVRIELPPPGLKNRLWKCSENYVVEFSVDNLIQWKVSMNEVVYLFKICHDSLARIEFSLPSFGEVYRQHIASNPPLSSINEAESPAYLLPLASPNDNEFIRIPKISPQKSSRQIICVNQTPCIKSTWSTLVGIRKYMAIRHALNSIKIVASEPLAW